jgi:hypothetical protein
LVLVLDLRNAPAVADGASARSRLLMRKKTSFTADLSAAPGLELGPEPEPGAVLELGFWRRAVRALPGMWIDVPSSRFQTLDSSSTGKLTTGKFLGLTFCADITVTAKKMYCSQNSKLLSSFTSVASTSLDFSNMNAFKNQETPENSFRTPKTLQSKP